MPTFRPIKACDVGPDSGYDLRNIKYPVLGSFKVDGWRCLTTLQGPVTYKLKPIPNNYVREFLAATIGEGLDGELVVRRPNTKFITSYNDELRDFTKNYLSFNDIQSSLSSQSGAPDFQYLVFDKYNVTEPYINRYQRAKALVEAAGTRSIRMLPAQLIESYEQLLAYEAIAVSYGFEGICLRSPHAAYKYGRSTFNEGYLLKLKRFVDEEAQCVGFEPWYENTNDQTINELGLTERGHSSAGRIARDWLGSILAWHPKYGTFSIGSGFTLDQRIAIWSNRPHFLNAWFTFKHLPHGRVDKPRHPVFKSFRHPAT